MRWFAENQPFTPIIETTRWLLLGTPLGNSALIALAWCVGIALGRTPRSASRLRPPSRVMTGPATNSDPAAAAMLTIGQLAEYVGVTVRAIRHYHQRGLLAEPARDSSGYRRYGAQAVLDLIRIKVLSHARVPLARIDELLDAGAEQLAEAVAQIDEALQRQIRELERRRRQIADLVGGEEMFLPAAGVSARTVQIERDGWILLIARYPQRSLEWLGHKRADLADPEFQRLYRGYDEAVDWDPAGPRLEKLADAMVRYLVAPVPARR